MATASSLYELLQDRESITCKDAADALGVSHGDLISWMKSLEANGVLKTELMKTTCVTLTQDGVATLQGGSYEYRVASKLNDLSNSHPQGQECPVKKSELSQYFSEGDLMAGIAGCMRSKWIRIISSGKKDPDPGYELNLPLASISDDTRALLQSLVIPGTTDLVREKIDDDLFKQLKQRKLATTTELKHFVISKGEKYGAGMEKPSPDLTIEMVRQHFLNNSTAENSTKAGASSSNFNIKPLNFESLGAVPSAGAFHPLMEMRRLFVEVFVGMGFEQMETPKLVESSFWNFDALFQPQSHPARDSQDTFFVGGKYSRTNQECLDPALVERIKRAHETGGPSMQSKGYRYVWKMTETLRNILRTHTTAVSARKLYEIGQHYQKTGEFRPRRFFSIDRVYRNETLDATHLCEFNQVEGMVIDRHLTLGNLIATLRTFFARLGMTQLRFKATYNPYTAPSMEIFAFHTQLKRWVEVGNSGLFRPEVLLPLGLPEDVQVLAWGLSLERPTMIIHELSNIRDLVGPSTSLELIRGYRVFTPAHICL